MTGRSRSNGAAVLRRPSRLEWSGIPTTRGTRPSSGTVISCATRTDIRNWRRKSGKSKANNEMIRLSEISAQGAFLCLHLPDIRLKQAGLFYDLYGPKAPVLRTIDLLCTSFYGNIGQRRGITYSGAERRTAYGEQPSWSSTDKVS